jgi:hypothetical protein
MEGEDDGKVSVECAKREEMNAFFVMESARIHYAQSGRIDQRVFYLM